jgi:hypothetical protein
MCGIHKSGFLFGVISDVLLGLGLLLLAYPLGRVITQLQVAAASSVAARDLVWELVNQALLFFLLVVRDGRLIGFGTRWVKFAVLDLEALFLRISHLADQAVRAALLPQLNQLVKRLASPGGVYGREKILGDSVLPVVESTLFLLLVLDVIRVIHIHPRVSPAFQVTEFYLLELLQEGHGVVLQGPQRINRRLMVIGILIQVIHGRGLPVPQDVVFKFIPKR